MLSLFAALSRLHIVAIAAMGTFTFGWIFTGAHPWLATGVAALDWFLVNLANRAVDTREDRENRIRGAEVAGRHRRVLAGATLGTLATSLVLVHLVAPELTPFRLVGHALGLAYNWPLLPGRRRIKQLYFWKNTASATGFLVTVFGYPLAPVVAGRADFAPGTGWTAVLAAMAFFFLFELSYEVIYDLRDVAGDRLAAVRTYPVVHGEAVGARVVEGLLLSSFAVIAVAFLAGLVPWRVAVMGAAPLVQLALFRRFRREGIREAHCVGLTWLGAGLLLTWHVWEALGLPGAGA